MSTETVKSANTMAGGWTDFHNLTDADLAVFNKALKGLDGVNYTPEQVATQVVAGTNYKFKCKAVPVVLDPVEYTAIVEIFESLDGKVSITQIIKE